MSVCKRYAIVPLDYDTTSIPPIPILNTSKLQGPTFENICTPTCGVSRFCPETHDRKFMLIEC